MRIILKRVILIFAIFIIAFAARFYLISATGENNNFIDLCIYIDGGHLVSYGINPYDYSDGVEIREKLMTDSEAYYPTENQEDWNNATASNLPLTLLLFGAIDRIYPEPIGYRLIFTIFDCLLSVFIGLFMMNYWSNKMSFEKFLMILGLSALSPILINWGVLLPEDKGIQILLMVSALFFCPL